MFSRRFFAWVGVGVLSAATIPTLAAPQLAKLAVRKPAAKTAVAKSTITPKATAKTAAHSKTPAKAPVKTAAHKPAAAHLKTPATKLAAKSPSRNSTSRVTQRHPEMNMTAAPASHKTPPAVTHKPVTPLKSLAHKSTPASTAKKLLH